MNQSICLALVVNQLLEPAIATHISDARQPCAWRCARHVIGLFAVCWFAVCLFAMAAFALDPEKAITQLVHTAWTEKDGAPANIVAITQTKDGYLWLGTKTGLFSFDGIRFVPFEPRAGEDLSYTRIRTLLATRDGSLWMVFASGSVSRLLNGHVTSYSEREGLPATFVLVECKDGSLIAGTAKGLARFEGGTWKDISREWNFPDKRAQTIYFDRAGTLWVVTEDRIVYLPSGEKQFVDSVETAAKAYNFAEAPDGAIWISDIGRSAHTVRRPGDHSPMTEVRVGADCMLFDRDGALWVGSIGDGLRRVAQPDRVRGHRIAQFGPEAEQFTAKDGLSGNVVLSLFEDREGNIWSGSSIGLDRFREGAFTPVSIPHADMSKGILSTSDGSLWTFTDNEITRIAPRRNPEVLPPSGTDSTRGADSMSEDESGILWLVGVSEGSKMIVSRFQQGRFVSVINSRHPLPGGIALKSLDGITHDREGGIWLFDLNQGLFRLAASVITKIAEQSEPIYPWEVLYADRNDRIWVGQNNHVAIHDHGKSQIFGTSDGVPPGPVFTIYQDHTGNVWAGGVGGLSKFENGRFHLLSKFNELPMRSVFGMVEDYDSNWWLGTDVGVLRIPAGELDRAVANPTYRIRYEPFNLLDGLPGRPKSTFPGPMVVRTRDGRIWCATTNGLAYADPRRIPKNELPPPVHVETVKLDDKAVAPADWIVLTHSTRNIEIDYTALSLSMPERVLFRYKLEGSDAEWQEPGTRRQAFYTDLHPGNYRFRVIACNNDGVWNEEGATLNFSVAPAWFQTSWFRSLCVVVGAVVTWAVYRLRVRQVARVISARFDERLAERTRMARELHDTFLQTIQGSKLVADNALDPSTDLVRMRHAMEQLSTWLEQAMREGRAALNSLRTSTIQKNDLAEAFRRATDSGLMSGSMQATFSIVGEAGEMHPIVRDEVYRIGYEAICNAYKHSQASRLDVELRYTQDLALRVRDNGVGIDPSIAALGKDGHFGLRGMRERAARIGGKLTLVSSANSGTEITLVIPGSIVFQKNSAAPFKKMKALLTRIVRTPNPDRPTR